MVYRILRTRSTSQRIPFQERKPIRPVQNTGKTKVYVKGWGMKTLRNQSGITVLAGILILAVVTTLGTVGLPGVESSHAAVAAGPGGVNPTPQAVDMFLKLEGVDGESTNAAHKGWIEVLSWSWGASQMGSGGGGGGAAGRGELKGHVTLIKRIDKATPLLFKRCSDGTVLALVTVELTRGGGQTYLKYELKEVFVSSIAHGDVDGDGLLEEEIKLEFMTTKLTYTQFDASGKPAGQTSAEGGSVPVIR
jgi:type VI secretion system secreted protein Hcp